MSEAVSLSPPSNWSSVSLVSLSLSWTYSVAIQQKIHHHNKTLSIRPVDYDGREDNLEKYKAMKRGVAWMQLLWGEAHSYQGGAAHAEL